MLAIQHANFMGLQADTASDPGMMTQQDPNITSGNLTTKQKAGVAALGVYLAVSTLLRPVTAIAAANHGYKRNHKELGPGIGWGVLGFFFPIITTVVSLFQGYAKPKKG